MDWSDEVRARLVREEERLRYKAANLQARGKTVMAAQELVVADDIRAALEEIRRVTAERDEWKRLAHVEAKGVRCAFEAQVEAAEAKAERLRNALLRRGVSPAPCDICGYNGHGYHQPERHACIADGDSARAALRGGGEQCLCDDDSPNHCAKCTRELLRGGGE